MRLPYFKVINADVRDGLRMLYEDGVRFDLICSSPPYYKQRLYSGQEKELGHERTSQEYVDAMVEIYYDFCYPLLKPSGSLFLNIGDSMNGSGGGEDVGVSSIMTKERAKSIGVGAKNDKMYKPRDLMDIPHRVYEGLRRKGYYWRSTIQWYKKNSSPESVAGVRWVKHKVKREECPGCPRCEPHNGYVLRWGSGRPVHKYEPIGLLTKDRYYWDNEAVRTEYKESSVVRRKSGVGSYGPGDGSGSKMSKRVDREPLQSEYAGANLGDVWEFAEDNAVLKWLYREYPGIYTEYMQGQSEMGDIWHLATAQFREAHFAVYPTTIPELAIKAATSEYGCCAECGAPWARVLDQVGKVMEGHSSRTADVNGYSESSSLRGEGIAVYRTVGWKPTCRCSTEERVPSVVLDPFAGASSTLLAANRLGRDAVGVELFEDYVEIGVKRVTQDAPLFAYASQTEMPEPEVGK